jgi:hypothetical protein
MSNLTRRAILRGFAASAAMTIPSVVVASIPDAPGGAFATLVSRYRRASAIATAAEDNAATSRERAERSFPKAPDLITGACMPVRVGGPVYEEKRLFPMTRGFVERSFKGEDRARRLAVWDGWDSECSDIMAANRVAELEIVADNLRADAQRIGVQIIEFEARTSAEILAKLEFENEFGNEYVPEAASQQESQAGISRETQIGPRLLASVRESLRHLAAKGGAA